MNTCEHGRDCVVVHDGLNCPMCDLVKENEDLQKQIKFLESEEN